MPDGATGAALDALHKFIPNPLASEFDALQRASRWMADRHNWVRVSWVIMGGLFMAIGATMIVNRASGGVVVKAATGAVKTAAKV